MNMKHFNINSILPQTIFVYTIVWGHDTYINCKTKLQRRIFAKLQTTLQQE